VPEKPVAFAKFPSSLTGPRADVVLDDRLTSQGDYEVELAVVIGRRTRSVSESDALSAVFGYAVANDVSARDHQFADGQWDRSKSFDTFCPLGPWVTTADEVADPMALQLTSWVNGEIRQNASSKEMVHGIARLISYLSEGITLEAGDVILTGTPSGIGLAMEPPVFLKPGDVVRCEIEGLGVLESRFVAGR
jgi:5-carboxymethyl-2-hydroxymuconate isomerase